MSSTNKRHTLAAQDTNAVAQALLTLTHELWVVKDRMAMLEVLLEKNGINVADEIETIRPNEAQQKALNEQGRALVQSVTQALIGTE